MEPHPNLWNGAEALTDSSMHRILLLSLFALGTTAGAQVPVRADSAAADTVSLSLDDAVRRATTQSEEVRLARASVDLAESQVVSARSQALPGLSAPEACWARAHPTAPIWPAPAGSSRLCVPSCAPPSLSGPGW